MTSMKWYKSAVSSRWRDIRLPARYDQGCALCIFALCFCAVFARPNSADFALFCAANPKFRAFCAVLRVFPAQTFFRKRFVIYSLERFCTLETQVNHTAHAFMKSNYSTSTVVAVFSDGKSQ